MRWLAPILVVAAATSQAEAPVCVFTETGIAYKEVSTLWNGSQRFSGGVEAESGFVRVTGDTAILSFATPCPVLEVFGKPARFTYKTQAGDSVSGEAEQLSFPLAQVVLRGAARLSTPEGRQHGPLLSWDLPTPFDPSARGEKLIEKLRVAAREGDPSAQWQLALAYGSGGLVPRDAEIARYWLEAAAADGHPEAIAALSELEGNPE